MRNPMRHMHPAYPLAAIVMFVLPTISGAVPAFTTVAVTGQPAPDTPAGTTYATLSRPVISDSGHVAFDAQLDGPDITPSNDYAIWTGTAGSLRKLVQSGTQAPGTEPGTFFTRFGSFVINRSGAMAFAAPLSKSGPDFGQHGIFRGVSGVIAPLVISGTQTGDSRTYFDEIDHIAIDDLGRVLFRSHLKTIDGRESAGESLWLADAGPPRVLGRGGLPAPGTDSTYAGRFSNVAFLNGRGDVSFWGTTFIPNTDQTHSAIWVGPTDSPQLVAQSGDSIPGAASLGRFHHINPPSIASNGLVTFMTGVSDGRTAIFAGEPGSVTPLVVSGDAAPGLAASTFVEFESIPVINQSQHVTFLARLSDDPPGNFVPNTSLWLATTDALRLIARTTSPAPGTARDAVFVDFLTPSVNSRAELAFTARISNPESDLPAHTLWAADASGNLLLVAEPGMPLIVGEGDTRIVRDVAPVNGESAQGGSAFFNDRGEIAFIAHFTDGSQGIFIATIPEPHTLALLCLAAVAASRRRRRTCGNSPIPKILRTTY